MVTLAPDLLLPIVPSCQSTTTAASCSGFLVSAPLLLLLVVQKQGQLKSWSQQKGYIPEHLRRSKGMKAEELDIGMLRENIAVGSSLVS